MFMTSNDFKQSSHSFPAHPHQAHNCLKNQGRQKQIILHDRLGRLDVTRLGMERKENSFSSQLPVRIAAQRLVICLRSAPVYQAVAHFNITRRQRIVVPGYWTKKHRPSAKQTNDYSILLFRPGHYSAQLAKSGPPAVSKRMLWPPSHWAKTLTESENQFVISAGFSKMNIPIIALIHAIPNSASRLGTPPILPLHLAKSS